MWEAMWSMRCAGDWGGMRDELLVRYEYLESRSSTARHSSMICLGRLTDARRARHGGGLLLLLAPGAKSTRLSASQPSSAFAASKIKDNRALEEALPNCHTVASRVSASYKLGRRCCVWRRRLPQVKSRRYLGKLRNDGLTLEDIRTCMEIY